MDEKNKILFRETQYFAPLWFFPALAGLMVLSNIVIIIMFRSLKLELQFSEIITFFILPLFVLLFYFIKLDTQINEQEIKIKFMPFVKRRILFSEILNAYIRKYRPIIEYGGWGLKGWKKSNRAYSIKGNIGLQLELLNSDKILIGTQKSDELAKILNYIKEKEQ